MSIKLFKKKKEVEVECLIQVLENQEAGCFHLLTH